MNTCKCNFFANRTLRDSGNQKNVIQGQRSDMENRHNKEHKVTKIIHTK